MKVRLTKTGTYTISGITEDMFSALCLVLNTANDRCFEEQEPTGEYYSNDDFVVSLSSNEREALKSVCKEL